MPHISFSEETQVFIVPRIEDSMRDALFYQDRDICFFQYEAALEQAGLRCCCSSSASSPSCCPSTTFPWWDGTKHWYENLAHQAEGLWWCVAILVGLICILVRR